MRIALVEWSQGGHHELHLKTAAGALAAAGHDVCLVYPEPDVIREQVLAASPGLAEKLSCQVLKPISETAISARPHLRYPAKWKSVRVALEAFEAKQKAKFDLIFFMFMDEFMISVWPTTWLDMAFPYKWAGIYMQPLYRLQNDTLGKRPEMLRRDHLLRSKRFKGAMPLDEMAIPWLEKRFNRTFIAMPEYGNIADPEPESAFVQDLLTAARGRPIVGAFGSLAKRKGILTLLRSAEQLGDVDCVLAIAGKLAAETYTAEELAEIDQRVAALGDKVWYRPVLIPTDGAFSALLQASSVCYIAYEEWPYSSGLQSIAAEFGVPCVVAKLGIMGERAETYATGLTIDPTSPSEAAGAIRQLLTSKLPTEGFARYTAQHRIEKFREDLCRFVEIAAAS